MCTEFWEISCLTASWSRPAQTLAVSWHSVQAVDLVPTYQNHSRYQTVKIWLQQNLYKMWNTFKIRYFIIWYHEIMAKWILKIWYETLFKVKSFRIWCYVICKQLYGLYKLQMLSKGGASECLPKFLCLQHKFWWSLMSTYSAEHVSGFMYIISISLTDVLNKMLLLSWYWCVQVLKSKYFQIDGIPSYL